MVGAETERGEVEMSAAMASPVLSAAGGDVGALEVCTGGDGGSNMRSRARAENMSLPWPKGLLFGNAFPWLSSPSLIWNVPAAAVVAPPSSPLELAPLTLVGGDSMPLTFLMRGLDGLRA